MMSLSEQLWCSIIRGVAEKFPELAKACDLNSEDSAASQWLTEGWTEAKDLKAAVFLVGQIVMTAVRFKVFPLRKIVFEIFEPIADRDRRMFGFYVVIADASSRKCLTANGQALGKFVWLPHPAELRDYERLATEIAEDLM